MTRISWARQRRNLFATFVATMLIGALPAAASADSFEPNDGITQAFGPLAAGVNYEGDQATDNDIDWFVFYTSGQTQLHITVTNLNTTGYCDADVSLYDTYGRHLSGTSPDPNTSSSIDLTAPTAARYFLVADHDCTGGQYRVNIAGALTAGPPAPPLVLTREPNDTPAQAFGPLVSGTEYAGVFETTNDADWLKFNTAGRTAVTLSITGVSSNSSYDDASATIYDSSASNATSVAGASAERNQISTGTFTASSAKRYLIKLTGDLGMSYRVRIDGNLVSSLLTPREKKCQAAKAAVAKYNAQIAAKKKAKKVAKGKKKRKLNKQIKSLRKKVKSQNKRVKKYC